MLGEGGPLASLLPGKLAEVVRLPETGPLEHFAESVAPIAGADADLTVPRLTDVEGNIEVYAGRRPTDLPLVVRSPRGLGEVAFAGVDFSEPPLADWPGRTAFLQALLRPYLAERRGERFVATARHARVTTILSGALRQQLGRSFRRRGADRLSGRRRAGDCVLAVSRAARLSVRQSLAPPAAGGLDFVSADRGGVLGCRRVAVGELAQGVGEHARESTGACRRRYDDRPGARHVLGDALQP